ncbi:hypothetical protein [Halorussus lipolyticus]|uniref:hypothetical protein n=1 Tax=Halorussus lipolyticus TaxID=3034024 RepID=UPI0023E8BC8C|nr:hypothetical protein [Halorussus sp. DT80]
MSSPVDAPRDCEEVLSRFITKSGFKALRNLFDVDGGGQRWITLGTDERILRFFGITDEIEDFCDSVDGNYNAALDAELEGSDQDSVSFSVEMEPIDSIDLPKSEIQLKYTVARPWQIPVTSPPELWVDDDYMPTADDFGGLDFIEDDYYTNAQQDPPLIYFIRDAAGKFHTRTIRSVTEDTIKAYPSLLQECWARYIDANGRGDNTALVNFRQNDVRTL